MVEPPFTDLVERYRQGDADAARDLFTAYSQSLGRLAERYLSRKLTGRVDGEDVVQSVFRTFFRRTAQGEFQIDSETQLWRLLVKITVLKARAQGRNHTAGVRDINREHSAAEEDALPDLVSREPGPEEAMILVDEIEVLLRGLPAFYCNVLDLRLQGQSADEIARRLSVSIDDDSRIAAAVLLLRLRRACRGAIAS